MLWPPSSTFNEFITSVIERDDKIPLISTIQYDEKVIDDIQTDGTCYGALQYGTDSMPKYRSGLFSLRRCHSNGLNQRRGI